MRFIIFLRWYLSEPSREYFDKILPQRNLKDGDTSKKVWLSTPQCIALLNAQWKNNHQNVAKQIWYRN